MGESTGRFWIVCCILLTGIAVSLVMLFTMTIRAHADPMCAEYKQLQAALMEKYHEQPSGAGLMGDKSQFAWTLFTSPNGEVWTMVILDSAGNACVVGAGQNWVDLSAGKGDPT